MPDSKPHVSCLCVSRPSRWGQLQRAVLDFAAQTYPSRELVIVVDRSSDFSGLVQDFVRSLALPPGLVRVAARTCRSQSDGLVQAAVLAYGNILTLWDDDNFNHPDRLSAQVSAQENVPDACTALAKSLYFFHQDRELFVVDYTRPDAKASERVACSTLMAYREAFPPLDAMSRAKPSEMMIDALAASGNRVVAVVLPPEMHTVGVAGDNLRGYTTHRKLAQRQALPAAAVAADQERITNAFKKFAYPWAGAPVSVEGSDGGAFEYTPLSTAKLSSGQQDLYPVTVTTASGPTVSPTPAEKPKP